MLQDTSARLEPRIEASLAESKDTYLASELRRHAEAEVESHFERLFMVGSSHNLLLQANQDPNALRFSSRFDEATGSNTPSSFRDLSLIRTEEVMRLMIAFCTPFASEPILAASQQAYDHFVQMRKNVQREEGEAIQAFHALENARTQAKKNYQAARKAIDAALTLEGLDVARYMPFISDIYKTTSLRPPEPSVVPVEPSSDPTG